MGVICTLNRQSLYIDINRAQSTRIQPSQPHTEARSLTSNSTKAPNNQHLARAFSAVLPGHHVRRELGHVIADHVSATQLAFAGPIQDDLNHPGHLRPLYLSTIGMSQLPISHFRRRSTYCADTRINAGLSSITSLSLACHFPRALTQARRTEKMCKRRNIDIDCLMTSSKRVHRSIACTQMET